MSIKSFFEDYIPRYRPRQDNIVLILIWLAVNNGVLQSELPEIINCTPRTVTRRLNDLRQLGLARVVRTERKENKRGKANNVWKASFEGLLLACSWYDHINGIDEIARNNKKEWIIFQEWKYISKYQEAKEYSKIQIYFETRNHPFSNIEAFESGIKYKNTRKLVEERPKIAARIDEMRKRTVANKVLCIDFAAMGAFYIGDTWDQKPLPCHYFDYYMNNPALKDYITKEIELIESQYFSIQDIKKMYSIKTSFDK